MSFSEEIKSLKKNIDLEVILMTCGIIVFFIPFTTIVSCSDPDHMSLHDYLYLFSGAIMAPTGIFAIANDNTLNMKINAVYLVYAAYVELKYILDFNAGKIELGKFSQIVLPFFFAFFVINCILEIIYIATYKGSLEERIARGEFKDDPLFKELVENDKIERAKEREWERKRIERNEKRKAEKEKKKAEKEAEKEKKKAEKEAKKDN
ncbi:hypothetical protein BCR36DRAFT_411541 [Piromyces finnis]|uniref:Uncharacterized protein n=1 Tax=Piromyces finnis TaxID=1754191 RepID=A0A1Y1VBQ2_9FUNG|nr:hypothetical protein BCR36DRAFT_411541 [Piromyces finnis]|eukprot:ORX52090.1 hypothetical protein BCR36DRAFT_411541 [Piromyces finnis]